MTHITAGAKAPSFSLEANDGATYSTESLHGSKFVLYFYPKDSTPGCTIEAIEFNAILDKFRENNILVLGISPDSIEKHNKFASKHQLAFPLLSDTNHATAGAFGVWGKKKFMGVEYTGVLRTTFVIDGDGVIEHVFESVSPKGHANAVCALASTI